MAQKKGLIGPDEGSAIKQNRLQDYSKVLLIVFHFVFEDNYICRYFIVLKIEYILKAIVLGDALRLLGSVIKLVMITEFVPCI